METSKEVESNEVSNNGEDKFVENKELEKRLLRKIDLRIMPLITLLYLLSFLDRVNIGNAKLANIDGDLKLVGNQFNWCLSIFFIGYILFEIPSNFMLVRTNPSVWIPFIMISWGIVMTLMAFVTNFSGLMVARFFLGVCEAGFFPGAIYYISTWYKRSETNSRIAILAVGPSFAGSFSGLLAFGILKSLNGKSNLKGWRWLFLIEGLMTIAVSIVSYFFLSNYPEKAMWLSEEERKYAVERLKHDEGKAHVIHYNKKHVYAALTDWKVYLSMLYLGLSSISFYSYALFIPSIVHGMGFDFVKSQLMSVPPFFCAGISAIIVAVLSDRRIVRFPFIIIGLFFGIIGYILLAIPSVGTPGKYVGTCIVGAGLFPATITAISWITNNIAGHAKRSISSAMIMMCANVGGAIASQIYRQQDAPLYVFGNSMSMGFLAASACVSILQYFVFKTLNKKKRENPQSFLKGKTEEEIKNMGDLHPEFIYNL